MSDTTTLSTADKLRLLRSAHELRAIARGVGPMHAFWDVIFDMEALAQDKPTMIKQTAAEWIAEADKLLADHKARG